MSLNFACMALLFAAVACGQAQAADITPRKTLTAFSSEAQLKAFFKKYADQRDLRRRSYSPVGNVVAQEMSAPAAKMAAPAAPAPAAAADAESVTNTQTSGVDEGGIVKVHGKHLVMLRRGRLFTVSIDRGQMSPVAAIDAFAPGADPSGSWYDEMLIADDTIAVIGYSYARGGTEIGLFDIDANGRLSYRSTYHMRSNDYYSSRNYASRQIGSKLIFYTPLNVQMGYGDPFSFFPAVRRWRHDGQPEDFKRVAPATRIYRTDDELDLDYGATLHSVTVCDMAARNMRCEATAVLGPAGRVFYVSGDSVYVWTTSDGHRNRGSRDGSGLFRIPLDGSAPSALKVAGSPVDQFSFLETDDGHLNVLVRSDGRGDGMWAAEHGHGQLALLRVALNSFSDGRDAAPRRSYRPLPNVHGYALQNRYVGDFLLYGDASALHAVRWDGQGDAHPLPLAHGVERIEAMGKDAVVVGSRDGDLHFTSVRLGRAAQLAHSYVRRNAAQGELRSHGFFYKPGRMYGGVVGLPILQSGGSASVLYLDNRGLKLSELGSLRARRAKHGDDGCVASCVDWYGNARPLFLQGRVFALMGYELVEGEVDDGRMVEVGRISYAPGSANRSGRASSLSTL